MSCRLLGIKKTAGHLFCNVYMAIVSKFNQIKAHWHVLLTWLLLTRLFWYGWWWCKHWYGIWLATGQNLPRLLVATLVGAVYQSCLLSKTFDLWLHGQRSSLLCLATSIMTSVLLVSRLVDSYCAHSSTYLFIYFLYWVCQQEYNIEKVAFWSHGIARKKNVYNIYM